VKFIVCSPWWRHAACHSLLASNHSASVLLTLPVAALCRAVPPFPSWFELPSEVDARAWRKQGRHEAEIVAELSFSGEMGCLGRFRSKIRAGKGKRPHGRPVPGPGASFTSEATCSTASSSAAATATSQSQSQDSGATVRPGGSKSSGSASSARSIPELYEERGASSLREFGLQELHAATSDFSRLLKIGEGGFGSVYKGVVRLPGGPAGGTVVAIKRLNTSGHQVLHFCFHG
uniref:Protein kinase domain-containing protein n=1 Tax=Aegilops tauschii subsp. strangulata TaxID=200361 RepID=A0A453P6T1_AEGTS